MGAVYLAHDAQLDRRVALKTPRFGAAQPEMIDRFFREARAMAMLRHPHLCPIYDVGEHQGVQFLTMAYIEGRTLAAILADQESLRRLDVVDMLRKLAMALSEAHAAGVIHRDLKPANIMIDHRGEPMVMDFGLARREGAQEAQLTRAGSVVGTPAYMAPEQLAGGEATAASDVYSLGVILYQLLCGRLPFEGDLLAVLARILTEDPPHPRELRPDADPALCEICLKAMARRVEHRLQSMQELVAALDRFRSRQRRQELAEQQRLAAQRPPMTPGRTHDLFVLYSALDDEPPPQSGSAGWVSTLVDHLQWRLRQLLGRREGFSIGMAAITEGGELADPNLQERLLGASAALWVASPALPIKQPPPTLAKALAAKCSDGELFVLEADHSTAGPPLAWAGEMPRFAFWERRGDGAVRLLGRPHAHPDADPEYYMRLDGLARTVGAQLLRGLGEGSAEGPRTCEPPGGNAQEGGPSATAAGGGEAIPQTRAELLPGPPAPGHDMPAFVFVDVDREDLPLVNELCQALESSGCSFALPLHQGPPEEIRRDLEANLLECDALLVVYGAITEQWVREQLRQWRKIIFRREKPLRALGVYEGPPPEKTPLGMRLPGMHVLNARHGLRPESLQQFLEAARRKT